MPSNIHHPAPLPSMTGSRQSPTTTSGTEPSSIALAETLSLVDNRVLASRRSRRLASHPVLFAEIHLHFWSSTWAAAGAARFARVASQHRTAPPHTMAAPCQKAHDRGVRSSTLDSAADSTGMK